MSHAYVIDTNLYVYAQRDPAVRAQLRGFLGDVSDRVVVSTVVLHELLAGATSAAARAAVERAVLRPFQRDLRLLDTDAQVWREAALIAQALAAQRGHAEQLATTSFRYDVLIAASCRRVGATLITANRRDFALIGSVRGFRFTTTFPE